MAERPPAADGTPPATGPPSPARPLPRPGALLEQAAQVSRAGLRTRRERLAHGARPIVQTSVAAALAWLAATELIGHDRPFFAPVAAVITLGLTLGQRGRRAVEIAIGVALGIAIADLLVFAVGTGTWQIAVVTGLAMLAATLLGGGPLLAGQAGISAVLVATLEPPSTGVSFERALDGLVGATIALAVGAVLLPVDPVRLARASAAPLIERLADALDCVAGALAARDVDSAERGLVRAGEVDPLQNELVETLAAAGETARLAPGRRGSLPRLERYAVAAGELGLAVENTRTIARGALRALNLGDATPPELSQSLGELATATRALLPYLDGGDGTETREAVRRAASLGNSVLEQTGNMSAVHLAGQLRLTAVDILRAAGMEREEAQQLVRGA